MNTFLSAFLLSVALLTCAARAGDTPWKTYGEGEEQSRRFVPAYARHRESHPLFFTTDAAFCRSLRDSQAVYTARASSEQRKPLRMGEIPLAALAELPADEHVSRTDNTTKEFLALLAYESGNIPCLEYLLRRGLTLTDREGKRLNDELAGQQRPVALALFLLYEPLTEQERERALEGIRQDAVLQREVERIYTQYLRLNHEAGGHAPVIVTPEERSRRTEPQFFNTPDFSLF